MRAAFTLLAWVFLFVPPGLAQDGIDLALPREAFSRPLASLPTDGRDQFFRGRREFKHSWGGAQEGDDFNGLGPLFNRFSCSSCHILSGRGRSPNEADERMLTMLVRLSVAGAGPHGGPRPHPAYGLQLNEDGSPGVPGEGIASIEWRDHETRLRDGEIVHLRSPAVRFANLGYGPMGAILASPRVSPVVFGMGLLEAIPEATLEGMAAERKPGGVRGQVNHVWDAERRSLAVGRFGLKANAPTLRQQIAEAFLGDMGVTTPLFPQQNCAERQTACKQFVAARMPEFSAARLDDMEFYLAHLAPPLRRDQDDPEVKAGEKLFARAGCAACHRPQIQTGAHPKYPDIAAQAIAPYSDLLLHDMGAGLADNRPDFAATGRDWRTPPLWGIGLVPDINGHSQFLHDGRARNVQEAILWHGGEARTARDNYRRMRLEERAALLRFLNSL